MVAGHELEFLRPRVDEARPVRLEEHVAPVERPEAVRLRAHGLALKSDDRVVDILQLRQIVRVVVVERRHAQQVLRQMAQVRHCAQVHFAEQAARRMAQPELTC